MRRKDRVKIGKYQILSTIGDFDLSLWEAQPPWGNRKTAITTKCYTAKK
jgi:hypothetical protein